MKLLGKITFVKTTLGPTNTLLSIVTPLYIDTLFCIFTLFPILTPSPIKTF